MSDMFLGKIGKMGNGLMFFSSEQDYEECKQIYEAYTKIHSSDIYLEEPEQNLFPLAQVDLVYSLLQEIKNRGDSIFMATHSPYILYALNNCMLGGKVSGRISADNLSLSLRMKSWINPREVAVWELRDGILSSNIDTKKLTLQDRDGLIRGNYFDRVMKQIMLDFSNYSAYYE